MAGHTWTGYFREQGEMRKVSPPRCSRAPLAVSVGKKCGGTVTFRDARSLRTLVFVAFAPQSLRTRATHAHAGCRKLYVSTVGSRGHQAISTRARTNRSFISAPCHEFGRQKQFNTCGPCLHLAPPGAPAGHGMEAWTKHGRASKFQRWICLVRARAIPQKSGRGVPNRALPRRRRRNTRSRPRCRPDATLKPCPALTSPGWRSFHGECRRSGSNHSSAPAPARCCHGGCSVYIFASMHTGSIAGVPDEMRQLRSINLSRSCWEVGGGCDLQPRKEWVGLE